MSSLVRNIYNDSFNPVTQDVLHWLGSLPVQRHWAAVVADVDSVAHFFAFGAGSIGGSVGEVFWDLLACVSLKCLWSFRG